MSPSIARVDNGYVYGLTQGTVTITAKVNGTSYTATCEVKVERNTADVITASVAAGAPLNFSSIQSRLQTQASNVLGRSLSYLSGCRSPPARGLSTTVTSRTAIPARVSVPASGTM